VAYRYVNNCFLQVNELQATKNGWKAFSEEIVEAIGLKWRRMVLRERMIESGWFYDETSELAIARFKCHNMTFYSE
jgi:hypothetical protein